jgi:hypothetical protein
LITVSAAATGVVFFLVPFMASRKGMPTDLVVGQPAE